MTNPKHTRRVTLVYQGGIANVFEFDYDKQKHRRLLQDDYRTCESFARGCGAMGAQVRTMACNQAGDCVNLVWSDDLAAQPFSDKFQPVIIN